MLQLKMCTNDLRAAKVVFLRMMIAFGLPSSAWGFPGGIAIILEHTGIDDAAGLDGPSSR